MPGYLYYTVFFLVMTVLCFVIGFRFLSVPGNMLYVKGNRNLLMPVLSALVLIFWLGNRPLFGGYFGDTGNYAMEYLAMSSPSFGGVNWGSEWLWQWLMITCCNLGLSASTFFTIVEAGYIGFALVATCIILPRNTFLGWLFVLDSLMFFTFGTNGLRNGLACNAMLLAFALMFDGKKIASAILCLVAFGIHRSTILPIASLLASMTVFRNAKYAIYFWLMSIAVSLVAGGAATGFFASLGFDDRMTQYTTHQYDNVSEGRFRWDFLLYSAMPVVFGYYIIIKRRISENWYNALFVTYCLCNAFWVLVIRSNFSNRFAYLSWFMYPFLIAYPLIMMPTYRNDQDRNTGYILIAYSLFTLGMQWMWGYIRF